MKEYPAGGDSLFEWVRFAFLLLVAAAGAAIWSVLDRRRTAHPLLLDLLRTYVRYSLAFTMMFYGVIKVLPIQFQPLRLGLSRIVTRLQHIEAKGYGLAILWPDCKSATPDGKPIDYEPATSAQEPLHYSQPILDGIRAYLNP